MQLGVFAEGSGSDEDLLAALEESALGKRGKKGGRARGRARGRGRGRLEKGTADDML